MSKGKRSLKLSHQNALTSVGLQSGQDRALKSVRVYLASQRERGVKAYAVLDEQSSKSLARTEFFGSLVLHRAWQHTP